MYVYIYIDYTNFFFLFWFSYYSFLRINGFWFNYYSFLRINGNYLHSNFFPFLNNLSFFFQTFCSSNLGFFFIATLSLLSSSKVPIFFFLVFFVDLGLSSLVWYFALWGTSRTLMYMLK